MGPAAYSQGEQFQRERRTLFANAWLPFAASAQMPMFPQERWLGDRFNT